MRERYSTQLAVAAGTLVLAANAVFSLVQSPELTQFGATSAVRSAPAVPHEVSDRTACGGCHESGGNDPYPPTHAGWNTASCLKCHSPEDLPPQPAIRPNEQGAGEKAPNEQKPAQQRARKGQPLPHPLEEMEDCLRCHGPQGSMPFPENHAGRAETGCTACHRPGSGPPPVSGEAPSR